MVRWREWLLPVEQFEVRRWNALYSTVLCARVELVKRVCDWSDYLLLIILLIYIILRNAEPKSDPGWIVVSLLHDPAIVWLGFWLAILCFLQIWIFFAICELWPTLINTGNHSHCCRSFMKFGFSSAVKAAFILIRAGQAWLWLRALWSTRAIPCGPRIECMQRCSKFPLLHVYAQRLCTCTQITHFCHVERCSPAIAVCEPSAVMVDIWDVRLQLSLKAR